jgi:hypothetical protein
MFWMPNNYHSTKHDKVTAYDVNAIIMYYSEVRNVTQPDSKTVPAPVSHRPAVTYRQAMSLQTRHYVHV